MSPREFLKYRLDEGCLSRGDFFPGGCLTPEVDAPVGVVLLGPGGPESRADVPRHLYRYYMDPVAVRLPLSRMLRHWVSRFAAARRSGGLRRKYEAIGGRAPVNRLAREQAAALETSLNRRYGADRRFRVFVSMRYNEDGPEAVLAALEKESIRDVILLPLYPQYARETTGSALAHWSAALAGLAAPPDVRAITEYAAEPSFIEALSDRMDRGLQAFARSRRADVTVIFVAHGAGLIERGGTCDPYCCLVHRTVNAVFRQRAEERQFEVAFQEREGASSSTEPRLADVLARLGRGGAPAVLLVPVAFVTDRLDSAYGLDVTVRSLAERSGIGEYQVSAPLNCHPLLIESWSDAVARRIATDESPLLGAAPQEELDCPRPSWKMATPSAVCSDCAFHDGFSEALPRPVMLAPVL